MGLNGLIFCFSDILGVVLGKMSESATVQKITDDDDDNSPESTNDLLKELTVYVFNNWNESLSYSVVHT